VGGCSGLLEQMNTHGVKPNIITFTQLLDTIPSTRAAEQVIHVSVHHSSYLLE
jgi:hypothetical protein